MDMHAMVNTGQHHSRVLSRERALSLREGFARRVVHSTWMAAALFDAFLI